MNDFTTTIGNTVYFPSEKDLIKNNYCELYILFHEKVHVNDGANKSIKFKFLYLFPQILIPFLLLFCFYIWWLGLALAVLCILPYPAYFRKNYELKAYKVTLFVENEMLKEIGWSEESRIKHLEDSTITYNKQFISGAYYYMWRRGVEKELDETVKKILRGDILLDDEFYGEIKGLLEESKHL